MIPLLSNSCSAFLFTISCRDSCPIYFELLTPKELIRVIKENILDIFCILYCCEKKWIILSCSFAGRCCNNSKRFSGVVFYK